MIVQLENPNPADALTRVEWEKRVRALGGFVTVWPLGGEAPTARYETALDRRRTTGIDSRVYEAPSGANYYVLAPDTVLLGTAWEGFKAWLGWQYTFVNDKGEESTVFTDTNGNPRTPPSAAGILGAMFGVPKGVVVAVVLVLGYAAGVQAGIFPPLKRLAK